MPERVEVKIERFNKNGDLMTGFAARVQGACEIEAMARAISLAQGMVNISKRFSVEHHINLRDFTFNLSDLDSADTPKNNSSQTANLQESVSTT